MSHARHAALPSRGATLPGGHAAPFLRMIDHPAVVHRCNWMLGGGFAVDSSTAICSVQGSSGQRLHAGGAPNGPMNTYEVVNGRIFVAGSINVVWQVRGYRQAFP